MKLNELKLKLKLKLNKLALGVSLLIVSASSFAAEDKGLVGGILTTITSWAGLGQTAALAVSGLLGLVMFIGGVLAFKGSQQSQTTKGMAAVSVVVGLVLMYAAYMIKGSAKELGIDAASNYSYHSEFIVMNHQPLLETNLLAVQA